MAAYLVRRIRGDRFEVSKWEDSSEPSAVYTVVQGRNGWRCAAGWHCSKSPKCKHAKIILAWLKAGEEQRVARGGVPRMLDAQGSFLVDINSD